MCIVQRCLSVIATIPWHLGDIARDLCNTYEIIEVAYLSACCCVGGLEITLGIYAISLGNNNLKILII